MLSPGAFMIDIVRKSNNINDEDARAETSCSLLTTLNTSIDEKVSQSKEKQDEVVENAGCFVQNKNFVPVDDINDYDCTSRDGDFVEDSDCSIRDRHYAPDPESESSDKDHSAIKKITRWRKSDPEKWEKNQNKSPKPVDCSKCRFKCHDKISSERRLILCKNYWSCDFTRRKDFIFSNVESHVPIKRQSVTKRPPRSNSKYYFLESHGTRNRVCQKFFIRTLCISKEVVMHAFKHKGEGK